VPEKEEKIAMVYQMYRDDSLTEDDIRKLIERFGNQSLDFFGALRASTYDGQILCAFQMAIFPDYTSLLL
jgi:hypothetical protein